MIKTLMGFESGFDARPRVCSRFGNRFLDSMQSTFYQSELRQLNPAPACAISIGKKATLASAVTEDNKEVSVL